MVQGELFREDQSLSVARERGTTFFSSYKFTLRMDRMIIGILSILCLLVLVYSFGVERGKRIMEANLQSLLPSHGETIQPQKIALRTEPVTTNQTVRGEATVLMIKNDKTDISDSERVVEGKAKPDLTASELPLADPSRSSDLTVQLVTYKTEKRAVGEVNRLRANGHNGFIIPSGLYYQVCADYFQSRSKAVSGLADFKGGGRYPDAYIRTVVR